MSDVMTESRTRSKLKMPRLWRVIVHDDPANPAPTQFLMQLVVQVFGKNPTEARSIAEQISTKKKAQVGTYPREVAAHKASEAGQFAAQMQQSGVKATIEQT